MKIFAAPTPPYFMLLLLIPACAGASNVAVDSVTWADTSISTSANTAGYGSIVQVASVTWRTTFPTYSTTEQVFSECVTGSTLTMTTQGGRIRVTLQGSAYTSNSTDPIGASYLQDASTSGFQGLLSKTKGIIDAHTSASNAFYPVSFTWTTETPPPAGSHSWCLTFLGHSATVTFPGGNLAQFKVEEIR